MAITAATTETVTTSTSTWTEQTETFTWDEDAIANHGEDPDREIGDTVTTTSWVESVTSTDTVMLVMPTVSEPKVMAQINSSGEVTNVHAVLPNGAGHLEYDSDYTYLIVDIEDTNQPCIGGSYDAGTQTFSAPADSLPQ